MFDNAILRFLHLLHQLHWNHPQEWILWNKIDVEEAYHRLHIKVTVAVKYIAVWFLETMKDGIYQKSKDSMAILLPPLPFGPAQAEFCVISETAFDLANDLLSIL